MLCLSLVTRPRVDPIDSCKRAFWIDVVQLSPETISGMASSTVKYDFEPAQPTPGDDYDKFEERLLNAAAGESDDRGWSLADHMLGIDEGGPAGSAIPGAGAVGIKAQAALRRRRKEPRSQGY